MIDAQQLERIRALVQGGPLTSLSRELAAVPTPDVLGVWPEFDQQQQCLLFSSLPPPIRSSLLAELSVEDQETVIRSLSLQATGDVMALMDPDDLVDLIQEVSLPIRQAVLESLPAELHDECEFLLRFDNNDAAGLMTPRYAALRPGISVRQALAFLRNQKRLARLELIAYLYVLDPLKRLCGVVSLKRLLAADDNALVAAVMSKNCVSVVADAEHDEVAATLVKHDLIAVPVVDQQQRMLGIVTFDDVFDVIERHEQRHAYMMGGLRADVRGFFASSVWALVLRRLPWLVALLILGTLTTNVLAAQQGLLLEFAFLALFIPVITQTGGNVGGQSATLLIRDLPTVERLNKAVLLRVLAKEVLVGLSLALAVAAVMGARLLFLPPRLPAAQAGAVVVALMAVVLGSSLLGAVIPLLLRLLRLDPAVAAGPVLSTLVDLLGLSFYFAVAGWLLKH